MENLVVGRKKRNTENQERENEEREKYEPERKPAIDIFLNKERTKEREEMEEMISGPIRKYFEDLNMTAVYPHLFQLLWHSHLPCFNGKNASDGGLLAHCEFAGQEVDCREIFQTVATDEGLCCAFNAKDVLKKSHYKDLLLKMRGESKVKYNSTDLSPKAGKRNGLKVILDAHYDKVTYGSVFDDVSGMQVFVGEP